MRSFIFPAQFSTDVDGYITVRFRDVSEAITSGRDRADANAQAADCLEEAIAGRITDGLEIPHPTKARRGEVLIALPPTMAAKAALYLAILESGHPKVQIAKHIGVGC